MLAWLEQVWCILCNMYASYSPSVNMPEQVTLALLPWVHLKHYVWLCTY